MEQMVYMRIKRRDAFHPHIQKEKNTIDNTAKKNAAQN